LRVAVLSTLSEVVLAFAIAAVLGVSLGVVIGRERLLTQAYEPLLGNLSAVPLVLLYPLLVGLFGLGAGSKVVLGALYAFFPIVIASIRAGQDVDGALETAARAMGARTWQLLQVVALPAMVPGIVAGLRVGLALATVTVVAGEFISSTRGLGYQLAQTSQELNTPELFAWIVITLMFTVILVAGMSLLADVIDRRVRR
jgi:ABC-type nitrate/sulfonate/bicarbonate transport system permease component